PQHQAVPSKVSPQVWACPAAIWKNAADPTTVTLADADFPSMVAAMVTGPPGATGVTNPLPSTVAMVASPLDQLMVRPVSSLPSASCAVAVNCWVPVMSISNDVGSRVTFATGTGVTTNWAEPLLPSLVAVMVAVPGLTAVTSPDADTVATAALDELHCTVRPVSVLPPASLTAALGWPGSPITSSPMAGSMETAATGMITGFTVIAALADLPSLVAVIWAEPADTAVTSPLLLTVATAAALLCQDTVRLNELPSASRGCAV